MGKGLTWFASAKPPVSGPLGACGCAADDGGSSDAVP
jgi:hypothetical protein